MLIPLPKRKAWRILLLLTGILFVLFILGYFWISFVLYAPGTFLDMNVKNWKTYTNSREGYSFKYLDDPNWKVEEKLNELPTQCMKQTWQGWVEGGNMSYYEYIPCPYHGYLRSRVYLEGKTVQAWDDPASIHFRIETFENPEDLPIREAVKKDICAPYQHVYEYLSSVKGEGDEVVSAYCHSTEGPKNLDLVLSHYKDFTFKGLPAIEYEKLGERYIFISYSKKIYHIVTYPTFYTHTFKGIYGRLATSTGKDLANKLLESLSLSLPTIEEFGGWKTYTASNIGISFKYPKDYSEVRQNNGIEVFSPSSEGKDQLQVKVSFESSTKNLREITEEHKKQLSVLKEENISIDGIEAVKLSWERKQSNDSPEIKGYNSGEIILFVHNGNLISINKLPLEIKPEFQKTYEEILSTFKLTP